MTASAPDVLTRLASPKSQPARREIARAVRALRRLLDHPNDTFNAMEVVCALDGEYVEHELAILVRHPEGRRLMLTRPVLIERLVDAAGLEALPEGSVGRCYREHIKRYALDPAKLVEIRRSYDSRHARRDPVHAWLIERADLTHDLWHVLSGYGADGMGEAALLAFSCGQRPRPSRCVLAFGASSRVVRAFGPRWLPYVFRAWFRGRCAAELSVLPWEELLPLPLDAVRRAVGIEPPERAHPGGVLSLPGASMPVTA